MNQILLYDAFFQWSEHRGLVIMKWEWLFSLSYPVAYYQNYLFPVSEIFDSLIRSQFPKREYFTEHSNGAMVVY